MIKNKYPGRFVVFEGIDGAGSTTQVNLLYKYLVKVSIKVIKTAEPTDFPIGRMIRQILRGEIKVGAQALQLLYTADRADHLKREIVPALTRGMLVVLDRYVMSTLAYGLLNLDGVWLLGLNKDFPLPDVTFLIDTPVDEAILRMSRRGKKELFEKEKILIKVRKNYLDLAKDFGKDVEVLNGMKNEQEIFNDVLKVIKRRKIL